MTRPTWLKVAMAAGTAATTTIAALAAGPVIALLTFVATFGTAAAALFHDKPQGPPVPPAP